MKNTLEYKANSSEWEKLHFDNHKLLLLLLRMEIKKISLHVKHLKIDSTIKKFLIIFQNNVSRHRNSMASFGSLKKNAGVFLIFCSS